MQTLARIYLCPNNQEHILILIWSLVYPDLRLLVAPLIFPLCVYQQYRRDGVSDEGRRECRSGLTLEAARELNTVPWLRLPRIMYWRQLDVEPECHVGSISHPDCRTHLWNKRNCQRRITLLLWTSLSVNSLTKCEDTSFSKLA